MSEPKKETVRIVLPPRREGQPAAGNPRENAMINLPPKPAPVPPGGAPLPPSGLKPPAPPAGLTPPKPPAPPVAPAGLKPPAPVAPAAPAAPAIPAAPKPAMPAPAPVAVKPEAKKETAKVSPSPSKPLPQATVQLTQKAPLPAAASTSSFKTTEVAPVAEGPDTLTTILGAAALVAALIALGVQFL